MNENSPAFWLWVTLATLTGSMASLANKQLKTMTKWEIGLALAVSVGFSMFVGSAVAGEVAKWWGGGQINLRVFGAVMWTMAAGSHILIPVFIGRLKGVISKLGPQTETDK